MQSDRDLTSVHYQIQRVTPAVTALISADGGASIGNSALIDLGDRLVLWDSGMTPQAARDLRRLAQAVAGRDVDLLINSHYHNDHTWGNQVFADLPIVSSSRTRELLNDFADVGPFVMLTRQQDLVGDQQRRQTLVDDPGKRADAGPYQVVLQLGCFMHRRRLRQPAFGPCHTATHHPR
jgi:glyoxylase-like metal-dependent hydrolase (beta-lactamase superfamily II)